MKTTSKNLTAPRNAAERTTVIALVSAGVGIVIQILSGTDFPTVPPGLLILLGAAAIVWFAPWRWAGLVGSAAGASQLVGLFLAGQAHRLVDFDPISDSLGLWLQLISVAVAFVAGLVSVLVPRVG